MDGGNGVKGQCVVAQKGQLFNDILNEYPESYEIGMFQYCYSNETPLLTVGAGPCLVIVVHNPTNNSGCLAHLAPEIGGRAARYAKAVTVTKLLLRKCGNPSAANIFLIGGQAFQSKSIINEPPGLDIKEHLEKEVIGNHIFYRKPVVAETEQVLYHPGKGKVYLLESNELQGLQKKMIPSYEQKSPVKDYSNEPEN